MTSQERAMTESGWHPAGEDKCVNLLYQDSNLTSFVFKGIFSAGLHQNRVFTEITEIYHVYLLKMFSFV